MHAKEQPEKDAGRRRLVNPTRQAAVSQPVAGAMSPRAAVALQRAVGNAAVARMIEEQRGTGHDHGAALQRCTGHEDVPAVQRSTVHDVLRSAGRPLDDSVRSDMEARLGADFSDVRVHTGSAARASAAEVGARAYTSGNHVVIGDGGADRHTLAHELTHVIQQRQGPVSATDNGAGLRVSDPSDRFEREAEANATRVLAGPAPHRGESVQRAATGTDRGMGGTVQRAPATGGAHAQGEHIFNALDALAKEAGTTLADRVTARIGLLDGQDLSNEQKVRKATKTWNYQVHKESLNTAATLAGELRDNERFRSATRGEPMDAQGNDPNSMRYGAFVTQVRQALRDCGTPDWNNGAALVALRENLVATITDQVARGVKRNTDLGNSRDRAEFDTWYTNTETQMKALFNELIGAARAVHDALFTTAHAAFGYEEGETIPTDLYRQ
ncbi:MULTISPECIES: eCIS core domain-containing protein [Streptomyces]|uniref:DUF4157 domain-containing protein n=1 Tax=Streptomyces eurythermus TaxID=42237 RepID=A0ABW6YSE5_9ACTN|nr:MULTISPECIES: DUF4157 domain-containing protein [Streptomyces]